MIRKSLHIAMMVVLAMNLTGAMALASLLDCGMACCKPGDWVGTTSLEAPSCCQMSNVTCGFETGQYEELFDTAICCFTGSAHQNNVFTALVHEVGNNADTPIPRHTVTALSTGPPLSAPVYLSNASLLC